MPFSEEDISYLIEAFITFHQYNYDRLIAETLFLLDTPQSYQYLNKILQHPESKKAFINDFQHFSHFEPVKEELLKLGNQIT